jgi:hypothetical protein
MLDDLVFQSPTIKSKDLAFCRWTPQLQEWERGYRRQMKNWPLWSLFAVALSLSVVLAVPDFREVVVPSGAIALTCAVVVAWIFVFTRAIEPMLNVVSRYTSREQARRFVATPLEQRCHWNIARQPDGSYITQFAAHFLIRNRLSVSLYPTDARLVRPRVLGELMPNPTLFIGSLDDRTYGTAAASGNHIPAGATLPVSCVITMRGLPKQRSGRLPATIEIKDSDGHCERVKVVLAYIGARVTT